MENHEQFMKEALKLAVKGAGHVSPNPMVGAVVVRGGKIVGRGWHKKFGSHHAEVNAIKSVNGSLKGATLYVTLEPCNHKGNTPPCTDNIIASGIKKVVYGMSDINKKISGCGGRYLKKQGLLVTSGVLKKECRDLNRGYVKVQTRGLPQVILKLASTIDGKIATSTGSSRWITGEKSRRAVHQMRAKADAIMVGAWTVVADNPELNVRNISGGSDPVPVIIDLKLESSLSSKVYKKGRNAIVYTGNDASKATIRRFVSKGVDVVTMARTKAGFNLKAVLKDLALKGFNSVLVEGGAGLAGSLLKSSLVDEVKLFVAPKIIGADGISVVGELGIKDINKALILKNKTVTQIGDDLLIEGLVE